MQTLMYRFKAAFVLFSTWRTIKFMDRRNGLSSFHVFLFFEIHEKNKKQNWYPKKASKN